jgi:hypothetical protein
MKNYLAAFSALFLPGTAVAQSAAVCLSSPEAEALVTYALPSAIRAMTTRCASVLPATTALVQSGPIIAARYQPDADRAWPVARVAFDKVSGLPLAGLLGEPGAKGLIDAAFGAGLAEKVKPEDCGKVDRMINILEPLPAKNMAMLITALMEFGNASRRTKAPLNVCPAPLVAK